MAGHPFDWAGVGAANDSPNQVAVAGENRSCNTILDSVSRVCDKGFSGQ